MLHWMSTAMKNRLANIVSESHNLFFSYLPARAGVLSQGLLKLFFSGITITPDQITTLNTLPDDSIIIYVNKYSSNFEFLFYHTRYKSEPVKNPEIGFGYNVVLWQSLSRVVRIFLAYVVHYFKFRKPPDPYGSGFFTRKLVDGKAGFLSLVSRKGFYRWFVKTKPDPLRYLIEMQKTTPCIIYLVPQLMFFGRKPDKSLLTITEILFGTENKPGSIRRIINLFKNPGKVFVEISNPLDLKRFILRPENKDRTTEYQALALRRHLLLQMNRHRQSITGPVLKSPEELKQSILTSDRLRSYMVQHARSKGISIPKVRKKADGYVEEIAARFSPAFINAAAPLVKWIIRTMFDGVNINTEMIRRIKELSRRGPLIFIPCHKSHMDYLVLPYILHTHNMPIPRIVAGKNMFFWPFGIVARAGGAFSIRRSFRGAAFYAKVFSEYVYKLLEEGFGIKVFVEGGRSRTGKLLLPKLGFFSILLNAYTHGACDDMVFVPIYIGYDRVVEEGAYLHELEGGEKEQENVFQVIKARKLLKMKHGRIYINIHEPYMLSSFTTEGGLPVGEMPPKERNQFIRAFANRIMHAIDRVSIVTPYALVACALLNCPKKAFSYTRLMSYINTYLAYLSTQNAQLSVTLMLDAEHAVEQALNAYISRNFIECIKENKDDPLSASEFIVKEQKRQGLEYYKNNCIGFLIQPAFTAMSILENDAFQFSSNDLHARYAFLQDLFKNEFFLDADRTPEYFVRKCIKAFIDDAIVMPHPTLPDRYNLTSAGHRKLQRFSGFLKTFFESYWIVLSYFMLYPKKAARTKNRLKKIQSRGVRMYKRREIDRQEALSRVSYQNAIDYFNAHGITGSESQEKINFYAEPIQRCLRYLT